jgi:hypothetical protein
MPKLIIYELDPSPTTKYSDSILPTPEEGDLTVFVKFDNNIGSDVTIQVHEAEDGALDEYTRKRKEKTILEACGDLTSDHFASIEGMANIFQVWSVTRGRDVGKAVIAVLDHLDELVDDNEAVKTNVNAIRNIFTEGGTYTGVSVTSDGTVSGITRQTYSVNTDIWRASTEGGIIDLIRMLIPAIKYEGFNPAITRRIFLEPRPSADEAVRDLILCFSAYSHIGNAIGKLVVRRVDVVIGKRLMEAVGSMGVMKSDRTKKGMTLPRLAIAFMPEYLIFRKFLGGQLQSQTESSINTQYKDLSFYGCPGIREMEGYREYHKEFSSYIYDSGQETELDDPTFLKTYKRWNRVSVIGYNSDSGVHDRMRNAITAMGLSHAGSIAFFKESFVLYRAAA